MYRIPRRSLGRNEIGPLIERRHFITPLIVGHGTPKKRRSANTFCSLPAIDHDLRVADGLSKFIEHTAGEHCVWHQPQNKVLSVEVGASYNCSRVFVMLIVASADESALCATERKFARRHMKLKATVIAGDDG